MMLFARGIKLCLECCSSSFILVSSVSFKFSFPFHIPFFSCILSHCAAVAKQLPWSTLVLTYMYEGNGRWKMGTKHSDLGRRSQFCNLKSAFKKDFNSYVSVGNSGHIHTMKKHGERANKPQCSQSFTDICLVTVTYMCPGAHSYSFMEIPISRGYARSEHLHTSSTIFTNAPC